MSKKMEDRNIDGLFDETINQFNYTSSLFDSLESKTNIIIVSISIIFAIALNPYLLSKVHNSSWEIISSYYIGLLLVAISFYLLLNIRRRKFKIINISDLKRLFIDDGNKNIKKIVIGKYVPVIKENFNQYAKKDNNLRLAMNFMRLGLLALSIVIIFILVMNNV